MTSRVLIVEDNEDNRRILRDLLGSVGLKTIEAESGEAALTMVHDWVPDIILMDIQLPGLDGYDTTRLMRAQPKLRHVPIIAVTSYALSGDELKAQAAGCDAYVTKPFSPRALLAKVQEYLPQPPTEPRV